MRWEALVLFVVPLAMGWLARRRSGAERAIALIATLASAAYATLSVVPSLPVPPIASMAVFVVGLIAVMATLAGRLRRTSQWISVGIGALLVVAFFVQFGILILALGAGDADQASKLLKAATAPPWSYAPAALLPLGWFLIQGLPRIIDLYFGMLAERAKAHDAGQPYIRWWRPAQWAALGAGVAIVVVGVALASLGLLDDSVGIGVAVAGVVTMALGPRLVGMLQWSQMNTNDPPLRKNVASRPSVDVNR